MIEEDSCFSEKPTEEAQLGYKILDDDKRAGRIDVG